MFAASVFLSVTLMILRDIREGFRRPAFKDRAASAPRPPKPETYYPE